MPRNVYTEINLHLVWHTKESRFLIKPEMRETVYDVIRRRACSEAGVFVHEIGGTMNHIHMAVTIPPTLLISEWIGKVKGGSSHDLNDMPIFGGLFEWQTGYGVVSFGAKDLPWVVAYVRKQIRHHQENTWEDRLERILAPEGQHG
jgi:putative transposase